jgi:hypothetical protein
MQRARVHARVFGTHNEVLLPPPSHLEPPLSVHHGDWIPYTDRPP